MKMKKRSRVLSAFIPQQFTRAIRALADPALAGITILAMTANAFDEDRKKALACGMNGFLSKPIVIEELISTLQNSLERV